MSLRVQEDDTDLTGVMEAASVEGLQIGLNGLALRCGDGCNAIDNGHWRRAADFCCVPINDIQLTEVQIFKARLATGEDNYA